MNNDLESVRRTRPEPVTGWAASDEGRRVLDLVLSSPGPDRRAAPRPAWRRPRILILAAAAVVATGAGVVTANYIPFSAMDPTGMCAQTLSVTSNLSQPHGDFDPTDPARRCSQEWDAMYPDTPKPATWAFCYHPPVDGRGGGGSIVYPADGHPGAEQACAAIGGRPIQLGARR